MIDICKRYKKEGFLITNHPHDTVNIQCVNGHIYADGKMLVASLDKPDVGSRKALKNCGETVMDGDDGLTVKFPVANFPKVRMILKPRYAVLAKKRT